MLGGLFELFEISFGLMLGFISSYFFKQQIIKELKEGKKEYENLKAQFEELKKTTLNVTEEKKTHEINEKQKQLRTQNQMKEDDEVNNNQNKIHQKNFKFGEGLRSSKLYNIILTF